MAIVRAEGRATAITEVVLETVSATGQVIQLFIVWQRKTHRVSHYKKQGVENDYKGQFEPTFAVSESGYMDNAWF